MPIDHENDLESFMNPHRKMKAIEESYEGNSLLRLYKEQFQKHRGTTPIEDPYQINHAKEIAKQAGNKAHDLVRHFFSMRDDWFHRNGYSLETLKKCIQQVNADYGKRSKPVNDGLRLRMDFYCDHCGEKHEQILAPRFAVDFEHYCEVCTKAGHAGRDYSKDETITREDWENGNATKENRPTAEAKEVKTEFF